MQLQALQEQYPRESFRLEIDLYKTLVRNNQKRREVAYDWLERHHPDKLKQHMEEIEPHTPYWWSVIDLTGNEQGLIGYRGKHHTAVVDVDVRGAQDLHDFWEPIYARGRPELILDPDEFYILVSREAVHVPPDHAAEMTPFDPLVGEFRVHYAGFFDPGFGNTAAGGTGSRAVLEVRSHEVPFILEHGQIVGRLVYEHMLSRPDRLYGADLKSNYQAQGLKLSKHFRAE